MPGKAAAAGLILLALASMIVPRTLNSLQASYEPLLAVYPRVEMLAGGVKDIEDQGIPGVLIIPPAYSPYSEEETRIISQLALAGWSVIVLGGPGFERTVARSLGFSLSSQPLAQYDTGLLAVRYLNATIEAPPLYAITELPHSSRILAYAPYSWIDYDNDGISDPGEKLGSHVVAAYAKLGKGSVALISAPPSGMLEKGEWLHVTLDMLRRLSGRRTTVYVDVSKRPRPAAAAMLAWLYQASHRYGSEIAGSTLLILALLLARAAVWPKHAGKAERRVQETRRTRWGLLPQGSTPLRERERRMLEEEWIGEV